MMNEMIVYYLGELPEHDPRGGQGGMVAKGPDGKYWLQSVNFAVKDDDRTRCAIKKEDNPSPR